MATSSHFSSVKIKGYFFVIGVVAVLIVLGLLIRGTQRQTPISPTVGNKASAGNCSYGFSITPPPTPTPIPTPVPTPTPTAPPLAPVCSGVSMSSLPGAPTIGSQVTFTCGSVAGATSYKFRYKVLDYTNGSEVVPETSLCTPATGCPTNVSNALNASVYGNYKVQCVPCNSAGCSAWETPW